MGKLNYISRQLKFQSDIPYKVSIFKKTCGHERNYKCCCRAEVDKLENPDDLCTELNKKKKSGNFRF